MIIKLGQSRRGLPTSFVSIKIYIIKKKKSRFSPEDDMLFKKSFFIFVGIFITNLYAHEFSRKKKTLKKLCVYPHTCLVVPMIAN